MNPIRLILTVGLPRSGKSTWARAQGFPIVNPDSIRLALHGKRFEPLAEEMVWAIVYIMIRSLLLAGNITIIVDATNTTKKRRQAYYDKFGDTCEIYIKEITTSKEECIRRASEWKDFEIIPVIERMESSYEPPRIPDEPFRFFE